MKDDYQSSIAASMRRLRRVMAAKPNHIGAHQHSSSHRKELLASDVCGCFYCLEIYSPAEVTEWVDEDDEGIGRTALCAKCGIDSVIGSSSGYPMNRKFLKEMHDYWF